MQNLQQSFSSALSYEKVDTHQSHRCEERVERARFTKSIFTGRPSTLGNIVWLRQPAVSKPVKDGKWFKIGCNCSQ
jgi:hypothetical protein